LPHLHSELSVCVTGLAGRARSCKSVVSAGADAARRQAAEREADVLDGDRRPFRRGGGVNRPSACASNPCYLCVAAALTASTALAFGGPRPPLPRSPGCGGGAGRRQRAFAPLTARREKSILRQLTAARRCATGLQLPHASVCPHVLAQIPNSQRAKQTSRAHMHSPISPTPYRLKDRTER
jgi:hypothetical protein